MRLFLNKLCPFFKKKSPLPSTTQVTMDPIGNGFFSEESQRFYSLYLLPTKSLLRVSLPCIFLRAVAQFGSALPWGGRGREFKSRRSDQFLQSPLSVTSKGTFFARDRKRIRRWVLPGAYRLETKIETSCTSSCEGDGMLDAVCRCLGGEENFIDVEADSSNRDHGEDDEG